MKVIKKKNEKKNAFEFEAAGSLSCSVLVGSSSKTQTFFLPREGDDDGWRRKLKVSNLLPFCNLLCRVLVFNYYRGRQRKACSFAGAKC